MVDFVAHKYDVLLATTIIENGLDISNANTIIINRADRYGLSQLYQLRGRVGRSDRRAYAYLLIPPEDALSPVAKKRLAAIREFSDLGSGFRVAALDLEIRGAGNLLGGEQSGHIEAVGFDMYMKLLEQTIKELKGEEIEDEHSRERQPSGRSADRRRLHPRHEPAADRVSADGCGQDATTSSSGSSSRCATATARRPNRCSIWRNMPRSGFWPTASAWSPSTAKGQSVVLKFRPEAKLDPAWLFRVVQQRGDVTLVPPATLKLDLKKGRRRQAVRHRTAASALSRKKEKIRWRAAPGGPPARRRARSTPGFTKDEIMRPAKEDPRADGRRVRPRLGLAPRVERRPFDRVKYSVTAV